MLSLLLLLSLSLSIVRLLSSFIYNFVTYHYPCLPGDGLARLALPASALQEVIHHHDLLQDALQPRSVASCKTWIWTLPMTQLAGLRKSLSDIVQGLASGQCHRLPGRPVSRAPPNRDPQELCSQDDRPPPPPPPPGPGQRAHAEHRPRLRHSSLDKHTSDVVRFIAGCFSPTDTEYRLAMVGRILPPHPQQSQF